MPVTMHLRDVPDAVHGGLVQRSAAAGMTLRQYVVDVLSRHVGQPTTSDWLDRVARRRSLAFRVDAAAVLAESRTEDDGACHG
jgi:hypothetical protein